MNATAERTSTTRSSIEQELMITGTGSTWWGVPSRATVAGSRSALAVQVCADARVQRMTLDLQTPVYRRGPGGERIFMADSDRPAAGLHRTSRRTG